MLRLGVGWSDIIFEGAQSLETRWISGRTSRAARVMGTPSFAHETQLFNNRLTGRMITPNQILWPGGLPTPSWLLCPQRSSSLFRLSRSRTRWRVPVSYSAPPSITTFGVVSPFCLPALLGWHIYHNTITSFCPIPSLRL